MEVVALLIGLTALAGAALAYFRVLGLAERVESVEIRTRDIGMRVTDMEVKARAASYGGLTGGGN